MKLPFSPVAVVFLLVGVWSLFGVGLELGTSSDNPGAWGIGILICLSFIMAGLWVGVLYWFLHKAMVQFEQEWSHLVHENNRNQVIIESVGDGLIVIDRDQKIRMMNPAAAQMLACNQNKMVGRPIAQVITPLSESNRILDQHEYPPSAVLATKNSISTDQFYFFSHSSGLKFPVAITAAPLNAEDLLQGTVMIFRDITTERAIDQAKTEFVSLASHQLRTPLSTIRWYAELLLEEETLSPEQRENLQVMYSSTLRMIALVNSLLDISRLDLGTFVVEPQPVTLKNLAAEVLTDLNPKIKQHNLKLETDFDALPLIHTDPKLMQIIFLNLLSNAVKYTPDQGTVTFAITKDTHYPDHFLIKVSDTGYGIPKDQCQQIFGKLFRASNVKQMDTEGSGLGLYLVKSIVDHANGHIWFDSVLNQGTTFYVSLPMAGMQAKTGSKQLDG